MLAGMLVQLVCSPPGRHDRRMTARHQCDVLVIGSGAAGLTAALTLARQCKVVVLAKDTRDGIGKLAFFGSVAEAKVFFEADSLEGIVRRINRTDEGGDGLGDHFIDRFGGYRHV